MAGFFELAGALRHVAAAALEDAQARALVVVYTWHATVRVCECEWGWVCDGQARL